ncbi:helix-turn-helix domain-containing protein [Lentzea tibetensis]|uniref:Helix-turn-helix domain-containing protein n=1 Tax=Lentzea tibetensis TaxID=2591470 RepID=A0A563EI20_9PSEU|nr:helix-turn-helix domain-containing protein [Lentzea tibetensis]TWP45966.1 helix-turn-helix domain-containing protein [Lentzea tibetensis]
MSANDEQKFVVDEFEDEFGAYLEEAKQSPVFRAEYEDADDRQHLIDALVMLRQALGLSQKEVAKRMGIGQPTVSGFEKESSDPKLSTLQRYARAVEARLQVKVDLPAVCDWVPTGFTAYGKWERVAPKRPEMHSSGLARDWAANSQRDYEQVA